MSQSGVSAFYFDKAIFFLVGIIGALYLKERNGGNMESFRKMIHFCVDGFNFPFVNIS